MGGLRRLDMLGCVNIVRFYWEGFGKGSWAYFFLVDHILWSFVPGRSSWPAAVMQVLVRETYLFVVSLNAAREAEIKKQFPREDRKTSLQS